MKKIMKKIGVLALLLSILILPYLVFAQSPQEALEEVGDKVGFAEAEKTTVSEIAGTAVGVALSLLGVIFISLIIYAGTRWMTAQGNEQEVEAAQKIIRNSIIGLIIVIGAYAIYGLIAILMVK